MSSTLRIAAGPTQGRIRRYIKSTKEHKLPDPFPTENDKKIEAYQKYLEELNDFEAQITNGLNQLVNTHNAWLDIIATAKGDDKT